uniref:RNA-directed DNA polymerase n=1 Tax=Strongyloides stercoralis TaxID=6248 RepID=A0AAF5DKU9_STRER
MAITGVAKGKLNVEGIVYVELKMDDSKFKTPIVVISGETTIANDEILLGTNFTSQFVCTYTDKGVYFGNKLYPNLEEINLKSNHIQENQKEPNESYPSSTVNVDLDTEEDRIFANFENVVSKDDLDVGTILMDIPKKVLNNKQYRKPPRFRYSPLQESLIVSYVRRLLENNIVIMKDTPFVTNFILVQSKNKSNEIRFAVDLRALNEITQPDMYITKTPNELMNYLSEAELFSTLDIRKAFWSMKIPVEDVHYYGVFTPIGTICFLRMPFGDINAMPNFQRIYDKIILQSVPRNSVAYVDDLLIFSKDNKEVHLKLINSALQSFEKYGIKINKAKSKIMLKSISFLGWEISNGMKKPGNQIDAIKNRKDPSNPKEMKSLLGALNFFRDTVEGYSTIVRPLQDMANNNKRNFQWNKECEKARKIVFEKLETKLLIPRFDQKFYLYTDASLYAISGAILQKVEGSYYPVKFYSKKLKYQKRQKSINMLEMQAIAYTLVANMELLYLSEIQIFTDNKSVITILRDSVDPDYTKYIAMISSFNFTISYINIKVNSLADFLSRQEENLMKQGSSQVNFAKSDNVNFNVNVINKNIDLMPTDDMNNSTNEKCRNRLDNTISLENRLKAVQSVDLELQSEIKENPTTYIKLNNIWHKKILLTEEKKEILVPAVPRQLREKAIQLIHDANGHMGFKKTWKLMRMMMFWPTCKKDLKNHIKSCLICQKYSDVKPELPKLKVSQLPDEPFKVIAVDVGVVPNYGLILQTICSLTKFWVPQIIKDQTVETIITTLNKNIFLKYGRPEMIICDSYPSFISEQFREFLKENNINLHVNTPYAKTKNSIVERSFRTMWDLIGKIREQMDDNRLDFETIVMTAAYYYNTHYQLTSDETPFYLVFNREERPYLINKNSAAIFDKYPSMADTIASTRMGWKLAAEKSNLNRSIDNERKNVKENRIVRQFSIGDKVLVRNYIKGKLDENYSGPYIIIKKNDNEYQLRKENSTRGRLIVRNIKDLKQFIN